MTNRLTYSSPNRALRAVARGLLVAAVLGLLVSSSPVPAAWPAAPAASCRGGAAVAGPAALAVVLRIVLTLD